MRLDLRRAAAAGLNLQTEVDLQKETKRTKLTEVGILV